MEWNRFEKPVVSRVVKKFPTLYGTQKSYYCIHNNLPLLCVLNNIKIRTTWNIIKTETNRHKRATAMTNYHNSPEVFNNYFLTISENIIKNIRFNKQKHDTYNSPNYYRSNQPHRVFPNINFKSTSNKETENNGKRVLRL